VSSKDIEARKSRDGQSPVRCEENSAGAPVDWLQDIGDPDFEFGPRAERSTSEVTGGSATGSSDGSTDFGFTSA